MVVQLERGEVVKGEKLIKKLYKHMQSETVEYKTFKEMFPYLLQEIGILGRIVYRNGTYWCYREDLEESLKLRLNSDRLRTSVEGRVTTEGYWNKVNGTQKKDISDIVRRDAEEKVRGRRGDELHEIYDEAIKTIISVAREYLKKEKNIAKAEQGFEIAKYTIGRVWRRSNAYFEENRAQELWDMIRGGYILLELRKRKAGTDKPEGEFRQRLKDLEQVLDDMRGIIESGEKLRDRKYRQKQQPFYSDGKTHFKFPPKEQRKKKQK